MKFRALFCMFMLLGYLGNAQSPTNNVVVNGYLYNGSSPASNVRVYLQLLTDTVLTDSTFSLADGSYTFNIATADPFLVGFLIAYDCTGQPVSQHFIAHVGNPTLPNVADFQLCHPQPIGVLTVRGNVTENGTNAPVAHQTVSAVNADNQYGYAVTDGLGNYSMDISCFQGQGSVTVTMNNCNHSILTQTLSYVNITDTLSVNFDYCAGIFRGLIPISGQYRRVDGTPVPNQILYIYGDGGAYVTVVTDSMGYYFTNYRIPYGSGNITISYVPDCSFGLHETRTIPFDDNTNAIVYDIEICPAPQIVRGTLVSNNPFASSYPSGERVFLDGAPFGGYNTYVSHDGTFEFPITLYAPSTDPVTLWFLNCEGDTIRRTANLPANASGIDFGTIVWCDQSQTRSIPNYLHVYNSGTGLPASGLVVSVSDMQGWSGQFVTDSMGTANFRTPVTGSNSGMITYSVIDCNGNASQSQQFFDNHTMYLYASLDACPSNHVIDPCFIIDSTLLPLTIVTYNFDSLSSSMLVADTTIWTSTRVCLDSIFSAGSILWVSSPNSMFLPTFVGMDAHGNIITHVTWDNVGMMHPGMGNGGQGLPLNMLPTNNTPGSSTLSGNVGQQRSNLLENAYAVLMDMNGVPLATAMLDGGGNYSFPNIAAGDYQVMIQAVNYSSRPANINLQGSGSVDFRVVGGSIVPTTILNVDEVSTAEFSVFPNPATDVVRIATDEQIQEVAVFDQLGRQVFSKGNLTEPNLDLGFLNSGLYTARITLVNGTTGLAKIQIVK